MTSPAVSPRAHRPPASKRSRRRARIPSDAPNEIEQISVKYSIGRLIGRAKTVLWDATDRALKPFDMTTSQWMVVLSLYGRDDVTASDICKSMNYDPGAMTRLVDRLVDRGFVRRIKKVGDRRAATLALTPAGNALYPKLITVVVRNVDDILGDFNAQESRQLEAFLKRIVAA